MTCRKYFLKSCIEYMFAGLYWRYTRVYDVCPPVNFQVRFVSKLLDLELIKVIIFEVLRLSPDSVRLIAKPRNRLIKALLHQHWLISTVGYNILIQLSGQSAWGSYNTPHLDDVVSNGRSIQRASVQPCRNKAAAWPIKLLLHPRFFCSGV